MLLISTENDVEKRKNFFAACRNIIGFDTRGSARNCITHYPGFLARRNSIPATIIVGQENGAYPSPPSYPPNGHERDADAGITNSWPTSTVHKTCRNNGAAANPPPQRARVRVQRGKCPACGPLPPLTAHVSPQLAKCRGDIRV